MWGIGFLAFLVVGVPIPVAIGIAATLAISLTDLMPMSCGGDPHVQWGRQLYHGSHSAVHDGRTFHVHRKYRAANIRPREGTRWVDARLHGPRECGGKYDLWRDFRLVTGRHRRSGADRNGSHEEIRLSRRLFGRDHGGVLDPGRDDPAQSGLGLLRHRRGAIGWRVPLGGPVARDHGGLLVDAGQCDLCAEIRLGCGQQVQLAVAAEKSQ